MVSAFSLLSRTADLRSYHQRCDGARPICGQCSRADIADCEYTDDGPTVSQVLEQNISLLEARIRALEGDPVSVTLRNPHQPSQPAGRAVSARQRPSPAQKM
jgi:hypothetical protein